MISFNSSHSELSNEPAFDQNLSSLSVVEVVDSRNRVPATPAARLRSKNGLQKSEKSNFLNKTVNFHTFFNLSSKNSLINRYFLIYLLFFKSSSRRRRDTTNLYLFICLRQLLKFIEISFTNIYVNAIFERIKLSKDYEERNTRSKINQSSCFESKNFVCW